MARGVARYLVGSLAVLGLAACGKMMFAEREPWRHEAEVACLKSGQVKEGPSLVRVEPIAGPGICGADFPLKVAAIGEGAPIGFADEPRPPGAVPSHQPLANYAPRPVYYEPQQQAYPPQAYPQQGYQQPAPNGPMSIRSPASGPADGDDDIEYENAQPGQGAPQAYPARPQYGAPARPYPQRPQYGSPAPYEPVPYEPPPDNRTQHSYPQQSYPQQSYPQRGEQVPLGRESAPLATG